MRGDSVGIIARFSDIMTYNIRNVFNKSKNPIDDMNKGIRELEVSLRTVKSETEASIINKDRIRRELDEYEEKIEKFQRYIDKAQEQGKSSDVRIYTTKKEELIPRYKKIKETYILEEDNIDKMEKMQDKLSRDIDVLKDILKEINIQGKDSTLKIEELQSTVDKFTARAEAIEEINNITNSKSSLDKEFEKLLNED